MWLRMLRALCLERQGNGTQESTATEHIPQRWAHPAGVFTQNAPSLFSSHSWPVKSHCEHCRGVCVQGCYHKYLAYDDYSINIIYYNSHQTNVLIYSSFICQKLNFSFKYIGIHLTSNYAKYILISLMYYRWDILENYSTSRTFFCWPTHVNIYYTFEKCLLWHHKICQKVKVQVFPFNLQIADKWFYAQNLLMS